MTNNLKSRRLELGMTQPELSRLIRKTDPRMDVGMISRLETGACLPTPPVLSALEEALQARREQLYGEEELSAMNAICSTVPSTCPVAVDAAVFFLGWGRENALSRKQLSERMGLSDRKVRELIEQARRYGFTIVNAQDGNGYYLTDDPDEMERQYRQDTHRALSILSRRKALRAKLKEMGRAV